MTLRVFVDGDFQDISIDEGEMYLLPGKRVAPGRKTISTVYD
jgi:hypothetical protein